MSQAENTADGQWQPGVDTARRWPPNLSRGPASKTEGAAWSTKGPAGSCLAVGSESNSSKQQLEQAPGSKLRLVF